MDGPERGGLIFIILLVSFMIYVCLVHCFNNHNSSEVQNIEQV